MQMVELDGAQGEGGGQILRSALSLSIITGRPVRIHNIRAGRKKPGLMRQHLSCVTAAQALGLAAVSGATLGSTTLEFAPNCSHDAPPNIGTRMASSAAARCFEFDIGSAGSSMLVLQTLIPILLHQNQAAEIRVIGGTHNPQAPSADYLCATFLPVLQKMGAKIDVLLERYGFYPAGGGRVCLTVQPSTLAPISMLTRGELRLISASATVQGVGLEEAEQALAYLQRSLNLPGEQLHSQAVPGSGTGQVVQITAQFTHCQAAFWALAERGRSAEHAAKNAADQLKAYLRSSAPVDAYLADQLLLPMLLAGGGEFICSHASEHLRTNAAVIEAFGVARIALKSLACSAVHVQVAQNR